MKRKLVDTTNGFEPKTKKRKVENYSCLICPICRFKLNEYCIECNSNQNKKKNCFVCSCTDCGISFHYHLTSKRKTPISVLDLVCQIKHLCLYCMTLSYRESLHLIPPNSGLSDIV